MERSPRLAVYVYATWPGRQRGAAWDRSFLEADPRVNPQAGAPFDFQSWVEKMPAELREHYRPTSSRNRAEVQVRGMRRLLPDAPPVRLIPACDAMLLLSQKTCCAVSCPD